MAWAKLRQASHDRRGVSLTTAFTSRGGGSGGHRTEPDRLSNLVPDETDGASKWPEEYAKHRA